MHIKLNNLVTTALASSYPVAIYWSGGGEFLRSPMLSVTAAVSLVLALVLLAAESTLSFKSVLNHARLEKPIVTLNKLKLLASTAFLVIPYVLYWLGGGDFSRDLFLALTIAVSGVLWWSVVQSTLGEP